MFIYLKSAPFFIWPLLFSAGRVFFLAISVLGQATGSRRYITTHVSIPAAVNVAILLQGGAFSLAAQAT